MFNASVIGPPYDIEITDGDDGGYTSLYEIGCHEDGGRLVFVRSDLIETLIGDELLWEFSFSIDVLSLDGSYEPFSTQEAPIAARYIPEGARSCVMPIVCAGLAKLVNHAGANRLYWVTKGRDLPEKALGKYYMLIETLQIGNTFAVDEEGTDQFGRRFWTMDRVGG
jgi:hypothetical protein